MNDENKLLFTLFTQWCMRELQLFDAKEDEIKRYAQKLRSRRRKRLALCFFMRLKKTLKRGPYCCMSFMNKDIQAIFNGDDQKTRVHIRISPNALVMFCSKFVTEKFHGWAKEFEVILFLYWLATGVCFRVVAVSFQVARSTAHMICTKKLNETINLIPNVIRLPVEDEVDIVGAGFGALCGSPVFNNAVGAIDGCQIRTLVPSDLHDQYINRKLFYSIILQGLVDHRGMFIDICTGFPGSVHDMRVLRHSSLWRNGTYPPHTYFILGDGGYQTRLHPICMVTPYRAPLTHDQANFNHHLSKGRCVVERAFGAMEVRWRAIFTKALEVKLKTGVKVIGACALLHNICITAGDVLRLDGINPQRDRQPVQAEVEGAWFRNMMLDLHIVYRNQQDLVA